MENAREQIASVLESAVAQFSHTVQPMGWPDMRFTTFLRMSKINEKIKDIVEKETGARPSEVRFSILDAASKVPLQSMHDELARAFSKGIVPDISGALLYIGDFLLEKGHRQMLAEAMQHPGEIYESPEDLLKDEKLSRKEKLAIFTNWANWVLSILEAQSENMKSAKGSAKEEVLLQEIKNAANQLK